MAGASTQQSASSASAGSAGGASASASTAATDARAASASAAAASVPAEPSDPQLAAIHAELMDLQRQASSRLDHPVEDVRAVLVINVLPPLPTLAPVFTTVRASSCALVVCARDASFFRCLQAPIAAPTAAPTDRPTSTLSPTQQPTDEPTLPPTTAPTGGIEGSAVQAADAAPTLPMPTLPPANATPTVPLEPEPSLEADDRNNCTAKSAVICACAARYRRPTGRQR
jgi:hypothetical protein